MKILYISTSQGDKGGGEYYLTALVKEISRKEGILPEVAMSRDPSMDTWHREYDRCGITVHRIGIHNLLAYRTRSIGCYLDPRNRIIIRRLIAETKPDIVHVNQQNAEDGLDIIVAALAMMPGRVVGTIHNGQLLRLLVSNGRRIREWWAGRFHSRMAYNRIFVSAASKRAFEWAIPDYVGSHHVIWNGLSPLEGIAPVPDDRITARAYFGISADAFVFGFAGRFSWEKNVQLVIRAFSGVATPGDKLELLLAGDGPERGNLHQYCEKYGVAKSVKWPGYLDKNQMHLFYSAVDVFVLPSHTEGFALVLIEALMHGIPVIATSVDGNVEALNWGRSGFLVPPDDAHAMSKALEALLFDEHLRARYQAEGKSFALANLTAATMAEGTLSVYHKVISGANTGSA